MYELDQSMLHRPTMTSDKETVQDAIAAFTKLHSGNNCRLVVRGIDRGELNLNDMACVERKKGVWVCTLPHTHFPLMTLVYEFMYEAEGGHRPRYSCQCVTPTVVPNHQDL
jgi:hypothetical protein